MSEQPLKYQITAFVDSANQSLSLDIEGLAGEVSREVMNLKERAIREGLIALGWTPPGIADKMAEALEASDECLALIEDVGHGVHMNNVSVARGSVQEALATYENHKKGNTP